jgi:hypothetical protein
VAYRGGAFHIVSPRIELMSSGRRVRSRKKETGGCFHSRPRETKI